MADTYTTNLRLRQPEVGQNNNIWGGYLNTDMELIDNAVTGVVPVSINGLTTYSLTANDGTTDQARYQVYNFTGTLASACTVTLPQSAKTGYVINATSGGQNVILTTGLGTTLTVAAGSTWAFFYCDGTNVTSPSVLFGSSSSNLTVAGNLTVNGTSTLTGNVTMGGTLGVTGAATLAAALSVGTTLTVTGASTLTGNVTMAGTLGVTGAVTLTAALAVGTTLAVTGASTVAALTASGTVTASGRAALTREDIYTSALGSISGAASLDLATANVFTATIAGATTFSLTNTPASGRFVPIVLRLTNGGSNVTWPSGSKWPNGSTPTLSTSGTDQIVGNTSDGGTTIYWNSPQLNIS